MGYRPDDQALETPIENILKGIKNFDSATNKRISSREWSDEHIKELNDIRKKMFDLQIDLESLNESTW